MAKKILITDVTLRDAHQSLIATRMTTEEMLPILEKMDKVGFYSLECWGGATFDACLRFLNEDPWDRLRTIREKCPNTKLQMLFRGQNMLGYRHYADDVLEYFVQKSVANGIDIIRIFDALNDIKNLQTAIKAAKKEKAHAQVAISYTTGPVFTTEYYVDYAKRIEETGADSICIKDMAALLTPYTTAELVTALKEAVSIPIQLHTHYTSGLASMCLLKGIEAGADILDTAMSPLALGTSHAPTESMVAALKGTEYDTVCGLDAGADDYLAKPFGMMELVSRVNALLRRAGEPSSNTQDAISCGKLELSASAHTVEADGVPVELTLKEFDLLRALMQNNGQVLSRSQLLEDVWGMTYAGGTRTVDVHVQTLRQKLAAASPGIESCIQTVRGVGYCVKTPS